MTDEEVIKNLKKLKSFHNGSYGTAIDMAIKALEQQTSDEYNYKALWNMVKKERDIAIGQLHELGYEFGEKIRSSNDCISREAVIDIIDFEDKWLFDANGHNANTKIAFSGLKSRVKALPSVTPKAESEGEE